MKRMTVTGNFCVTCKIVSNAIRFCVSTELSYPQEPSPTLYLKRGIDRRLEHEDFVACQVQINTLSRDIVHDDQELETVLSVAKSIHELLLFVMTESRVDNSRIDPKKPQIQFVKPCGKWCIADSKQFPWFGVWAIFRIKDRFLDLEKDVAEFGRAPKPGTSMSPDVYSLGDHRAFLPY